MHRIVLPGPFAPETRLDLPAEERHHLEVRRAKPGDPVELLDGAGAVGQGVLVADGRSWQVELSAVVRRPEPPALALLVGAGDRDRFTWLVEKAVELGVTRLTPLDTVRSRNVATRIRANHRDKLERRAVEALKQSGGAWALGIAEPTPVADAAESAREPVRWLADPAGQVPGPVGPDTPIAIAVGPEGGFVDEEREVLIQHGFLPVRLGPRVLRFETAALAAAVLAGAFRKEENEP